MRNLTRWQSNVILLLTAIIWGTSYIFIKEALQGNLPAGLLNALRGLVFSGLMFCFFSKSICKINRTDFKIGLFSGLINFLGYQLQTSGLKYTTPSNSAFLTATYIVMIPFVVWFLLKRKPLPKSFLAIVLCFLGTIVLTNSFSKGFSLHYGDALTLIGAFFYALQIVYFSNTAATANPFVIAFMLGLVQLIAGIGWSLSFELHAYAAINWGQALPPVIILGVFASFAAQLLQVIGQRNTDATSAGLILMTESLFGSLFSVVGGFEALTNNLLLGGLLIIVSILIMEINLRKIIFTRRKQFLFKSKQSPHAKDKN
ncbi:MAG: DMT family transporter [Liquorilactobacillus nagelii]|uniref:DMT family transporter n=1 Tax=Liquorilactobacillus nagelii TaxID=82688 RepID=UPI00242FA512|nr:DMT family transporter [Liquorilactobacillus nagelii]MCI1634157.1 DMT family transporter [Liquorilactobacillus nagelii]